MLLLGLARRKVPAIAADWGCPVKSSLREHRGGRSTLRKVERLIARGWRPGMTVRDVLGKRRRLAVGGERAH